MLRYKKPCHQSRKECRETYKASVNLARLSLKNPARMNKTCTYKQ
jgi:hypothetical protein